MNEWMNEWMNKRMNEWTNDLTNERMNEWMSKWTNERTNKYNKFQTFTTMISIGHASSQECGFLQLFFRCLMFAQYVLVYLLLHRYYVKIPLYVWYNFRSNFPRLYLVLLKKRMGIFLLSDSVFIIFTIFLLCTLFLSRYWVPDPTFSDSLRA